MNRLEYKNPDQFIQKITLEKTETGVRLLFPPPAHWLQLATATFLGACSGITLLLAGYLVWTMLNVVAAMLPAAAGAPSISKWKLIFATGVQWWVLQAVIYLVVSCYQFAYIRRWGHVPDVIEFTDGALIKTRRSIWGIKQKEFPATEITAVTIKEIRDIFRRRKTFELRFQFRARRPLVRRFNTADQGLAHEIADTFRQVLKL